MLAIVVVLEDFFPLNVPMHPSSSLSNLIRPSSAAGLDVPVILLSEGPWRASSSPSRSDGEEERACEDPVVLCRVE